MPVASAAAAALTTLTRLVYFVVMGGVAVSGNMVLPPPQAVQEFGSVIALLQILLLPVLMACIHQTAPGEKKVLGELALVFTALFSATVGINRYVQLTIVRQGVLAGNTEGLGRFMGYDTGSAMFAIELLGYGLFLGAGAFVAPIFGTGRLGIAIRRLWVTYGLLGLVCALGFIANSPLATFLGFAAWGFVLYLATALLAVHFRRAEQTGKDSLDTRATQRPAI